MLEKKTDRLIKPALANDQTSRRCRPRSTMIFLIRKMKFSTLDFPFSCPVAYILSIIALSKMLDLKAYVCIVHKGERWEGGNETRQCYVCMSRVRETTEGIVWCWAKICEVFFFFLSNTFFVEKFLMKPFFFETQWCN